MKFFLIFISLTSLIFLSFIFKDKRRQIDVFSDKVVTTVSVKLKKNYGLKLIGIGGAEEKGLIRKLNAMYNYYGKPILDISEARKLILDCAIEFLNEANTNIAFRPYMNKFPFDAKNFTISILNYDEDGCTYHSPYISSISLNNGLISYNSLGPQVKLPFEKVVKESYEEALAAQSSAQREAIRGE